jgi:hypothetical protein
MLLLAAKVKLKRKIAMPLISNGKIISGKLSSGWRQFAAAKGLTVEFSYRLDKLALRLDSIADKVYLKTVKAHNILSECEQLTAQFKSELNHSPKIALSLLTRLESRMDNLVTNTHEFRIKAG